MLQHPMPLASIKRFPTQEGSQAPGQAIPGFAPLLWVKRVVCGDQGTFARVTGEGSALRTFLALAYDRPMSALPNISG